MPGFGRIYDPDERDNLFQMSEHVDLEVPLPPYRFHACRDSADQGDSPKCVGYSWRNWAQMSPVMTRIGEGPSGDTIYAEAQKIDGFPMPHDGSSVRAGAKVLQTLGLIQSYVWADSIATAKAFILQNGPVVFGSNWMSGQMTPDSNNFIHATGSVVGGHAYSVVGYSSRLSAFRILNSWGRGWGQVGRCWISEQDLASLFDRNAEACAAVQVEVP